MMYEIEFGPGWKRIDTENGPIWFAVPDEDEPAVDEMLTIPEGYREMGLMEK